MTYLPQSPISAAAALSIGDDVTVIQNGISRRATLAQLAAFVASTAPAGESAEGTTVTTVGPKITDAAGNVYSISSAGYVVTNGQPETTISANVIELAYHASVASGPRQLYQKNASGNWFTRTSVTAAYTQTTDPFASTVLMTSPYFHVSNGQILTPAGLAFKAKGVNVTPYTDYAPSTYASVKRFFPGINFIRMVTAAGYAQGGQNAATVAQFISDATSDHCVVLVDNHTLGTTATGSTLSAAVSWVQTLATTYKNNPYVWFGTENEPDENYQAMAAAHTATYNAVRGTGNGTIITLDLRGGAFTEWMAGQGSTWSGMTNVVWDPNSYGWVTQVYGGSGVQFDVTTIAAAFAGEIAAVQAYHTADGVAPCIICEFGPSTSGDASTTDANAAQVLNAVFNSGYGWAAWALNGTGQPGGDALSDNATTLNAWGQWVAQKIAVG